MLNKDIVNFYKGLVEFKNIKLPIKVSFAIARNIRTLVPIIEDLDSARKQVFDTYAICIDESTGKYEIPEENKEILGKELFDLSQTDVELPIVKIKESDLGEVEISVSMAESLMPMLEEEV